MTTIPKVAWRLICKDRKTGSLLWKGYVVYNEKSLREIAAHQNKTDASRNLLYEVETIDGKDIKKALEDEQKHRAAKMKELTKRKTKK